MDDEYLEFNEDDLDEDDDEEPEEEFGCTCGYLCLDCLGMFWRDFM